MRFDCCGVPSVVCMLIPAIILISAALVLYTAGVVAERRTGVLKPWHAALFAAGLACDATGTWLMTRIADAGNYVTTGLAATLTTVMAVTGALALLLMAAHLVWAVVVLWRGDEAAKRLFHRFSLAVWAGWLVPYFAGMASAMIR